MSTSNIDDLPSKNRCLDNKDRSKFKSWFNNQQKKYRRNALDISEFEQRKNIPIHMNLTMPNLMSMYNKVWDLHMHFHQTISTMPFMQTKVIRR